jgi:membrane protease YdiL (CAAX protease family)
MNKTLRNILAISIAILPINGIMIWYRLTQSESFSTSDMLVYPLLFGGTSIIIILLLNRYLIKDSFMETFNCGKSTWYWDILVGIGLTLIYFAMFFVERATIYQWIPNNQSQNTELMDTVIDLANDPLLLIIWFGPVLWIGVALFEELSRTFLLKCLWNINNNKEWHLFAILLASILIGGVHLYQGVAGIITIALKSIVVSLYFYKYRRLFPLILSHALYDGLQLGFLVVQLQN